MGNRREQTALRIYLAYLWRRYSRRVRKNLQKRACDLGGCFTTAAARFIKAVVTSFTREPVAYEAVGLAGGESASLLPAKPLAPPEAPEPLAPPEPPMPPLEFELAGAA